MMRPVPPPGLRDAEIAAARRGTVSDLNAIRLTVDSTTT